MAPSGFGYNPSSGAPSSTHAYHYQSGWCSQCGRKRGADGRCANCDGWWTSPLLRVGGPVNALGTVFLLGMVSLLNHETYTPHVSAADGAALLNTPRVLLPAPSTIAPPPLYSSVRAASVAPASFVLPAPPVVPATPDPEQVALAEHIRLVRMVDSTDAALQAADRQHANGAVLGSAASTPLLYPAMRAGVRPELTASDARPGTL